MVAPLNTRDRILNAAEELFFQQGISVTGVDRVAATAGVAIVTLYKHFGSKDNLLREVLARRLDNWTQHWDEAITRATTPEERLLAVFDAVETFRASANPTQWCSFLATASERPAPAAGQEDPVFELIRLDTQMITERLARLAKEASHPSSYTRSKESIGCPMFSRATRSAFAVATPDSRNHRTSCVPVALKINASGGIGVPSLCSFLSRLFCNARRGVHSRSVRQTTKAIGSNPAELAMRRSRLARCVRIGSVK